MGVDLALFVLDPCQERILRFDVVRCTEIWEYFRLLDDQGAQDDIETLPLSEYFYAATQKGPGAKSQQHPAPTLTERRIKFPSASLAMPKVDAYGDKIVWANLKDIKATLEMYVGTGSPIDGLTYADFESLLSDDAIVAIYWH